MRENKATYTVANFRFDTRKQSKIEVNRREKSEQKATETVAIEKQLQLPVVQRKEGKR